MNVVDIKKEADCLQSALLNTPLGSRFDRLYAAYQALAWIDDPEVIQAPSVTILSDTAEGSEDCPSLSHPVLCG